MTNDQKTDAGELLQAFRDATLVEDTMDRWRNDLTLRIDGNGRFAGTHEGADAVSALLQQMSDDCGGDFAIRCGDAVGTGDFIVSLMRVEPLDTSIAKSVKAVAVWRVNGSNIVEGWWHFSDLAAWESLWDSSGAGWTSLPSDAGAASAVSAEEIRRLVDKITKEGDNSVLVGLLAPDVVSYADVNADAPMGGEKHGLEEVLAAFPQLYERSGGTLQVVAEPTLASSEFAALFNRVSAERNGKRLDVTICVVWRLEAGTVVEMWEEFSNTEAWNDFWHVDEEDVA